MTATKRRWLRWSLLALAVMAVAGTLIEFQAWRGSMIRKNDRYFLGKYIIEGKIDPEIQRGRGLFTDAEIDSMIAERDRQGIPAPPPARHSSTH